MMVCYLCEQFIEDGQAFRLLNVAAQTPVERARTAQFYHRMCFRALVDIVETEDHVVVVADPIGPRVNRYGEVVNDNGSWKRIPDTVQCQSCGFVLITDSDANPHGDPDCPRCGNPNDDDVTSEDDEDAQDF